jgi:hypothetical protein
MMSITMAERTFWQSLISFAGLRESWAKTKFVFIPSCCAYLPHNGTWIFPTNVRGDSGIGVMVGPAEKVESDATDTALGEGILAAISRSRFEKWGFKSPLPDSKAPQSAGFKSYDDLERGAALLSVFRTAEGCKVAAWGSSRTGGFEPVAGAEQSCACDASQIGKSIKELSKFCVPRGGKSKNKPPGVANRPPATNSGSDDVPIPFGYKMSWVAVPSSDGRSVAEFFKLKQIGSCSWKNGIKRAYNCEGIFVGPAVDRWVLALGSHPAADRDTFLPYLENLSKEFGEAFYFGTHRIVGYQAWGRAEKGKVRRAFGYLGERGEFLLNVGERTPEEIEIGAGVEDLDGAPNEETVLELAGMWVLDPREIDLHMEATGPGWFGTPQ